LKIRKKYFKNVKAPKYIQQKKCDKCFDLKEKREKAASNKERKLLRSKLAKVV
jgi:hypothetical protein